MEKVRNIKDKTYRVMNVNGVSYLGRDSSKKRTSSYVIDAAGGQEYFTNKNVLDLACASGAILFEIKDVIKSATGVDVDLKKLKTGKDIISENEIKNIDLHEMRLEKYLSHHGGKFDCIFLLNILHHLPRPTEVLSLVAEFSEDSICIEAPEKGFYNPYPRDEGKNPKTILGLDNIEAILAKKGFTMENKVLSENQESFMGNDRRFVCLFRRAKKNISFSSLDEIKKVGKAFVVGPGSSGKTRLLHELYDVEIEYKGANVIKNNVFNDEGLSLKWGNNVKKFTKKYPALYIAPNYKSNSGWTPNIDAWIEVLKKESAAAIVCHVSQKTLYERLSNRCRQRFTENVMQYFDNFPFSYQELFKRLEDNNIEYYIYNCDKDQD